MSHIPLELTADTPRMRYKEGSGEKLRTVVNHWGQLKLFVHEINFLLKALDAHPDVGLILYIGSAPGCHIKILETLISAIYSDRTIRFELYDATPFAIQPVPGKIHIHQELFFTDTAKTINEPFVLISDIRTVNTRMGKEANETGIEADNAFMHLLLSETAAFIRCASLKFRAPYADKTTKFRNMHTVLPASGKIMYQQFCGATSTETRVEYFDLNKHPINYDEYMYICKYAQNGTFPDGYMLFDTRTMKRFIGTKEEAAVCPTAYAVMSNLWYEETLFYHNNHVRTQTECGVVPRGLIHGNDVVDLNWPEFEHCIFSGRNADLMVDNYDNAVLVQLVQNLVARLGKEVALESLQYLLSILVSNMAYKEVIGKKGRTSITSRGRYRKSSDTDSQFDISPECQTFHTKNSTRK